MPFADFRKFRPAAPSSVPPIRGYTPDGECQPRPDPDGSIGHTLPPRTQMPSMSTVSAFDSCARVTLGLLIAALSMVSLGCNRGTSFEDARKETEAWRSKHETDYRRDWSTIAGLHFLNPGSQTAGSASSNQIVLPAAAPAVLGRFV